MVPALIPYALTMTSVSPAPSAWASSTALTYPGVRSIAIERRAPCPSEKPSSRIAFTAMRPPARKNTSSAPMYEWPPVPITCSSRSAAIASATNPAARSIDAASSSAMRRMSVKTFATYVVAERHGRLQG